MTSPTAFKLTLARLVVSAAALSVVIANSVGVWHARRGHDEAGALAALARLRLSGTTLVAALAAAFVARLGIVWP